MNAECDILFHGVNVLGKFGAGVALAIAKKYPKVKRLYLDKYNQPGWKLGEMQLCVPHNMTLLEWSEKVRLYDSNISPHHPGPQFVANLATQKTIGRTGVHVDYEALKISFEKLVSFYEDFSYKVLAGPLIGCGLGGGDKFKVETIINDIIKDRNIIVEIYLM